MGIVISLLIAMMGALSQSSPAPDADDILSQLSKIRLDKTQIYHVRDMTIRRDVLTIALNRGLIAFLEPVNGKVTGGVFIGSGEIVAIPPDAIEKQQVHKFTGTPILNEAFQTGVFRFTDNTYEDMRKEISQHAVEDVTAEDAAQFESWDTALAGRSAVLNLRLLTDFLEPPQPVFLAELNGESKGWFDVVFDARATEEVSMFQLRQIGATAVADVWASFNQRSEARNPETVAHEFKSPFEILSYDIEGAAGNDNKIDAKAAVHVKARTDGARVLNFELSPALRLASVVTDNDEPAKFYQSPNAVSLIAVLAQPLQRDQELTLRFAYSGEISGLGPSYPVQRQQRIPAFASTLPLPKDKATLMLEHLGRQIAPASYHDHWLFEGLTRYLAAMPSDAADPAGAQLRKLLNDSRDELRPVESAGAISLGERVVSTTTPDAYRAVYAKGVWVVHMLRMMLRQAAPNRDEKFQAMLQEFVETYGARAASTWDFKRIAEKYAGEKLDWFFDQWVFATGLPSYATDYKIESSANQWIIEGTITQNGVPDGFVMPVPLYADSEYLGVIQVGELEGQFKFRVNQKPERLVIDPEMTILTGASQ